MYPRAYRPQPEHAPFHGTVHAQTPQPYHSRIPSQFQPSLSAFSHAEPQQVIGSPYVNQMLLMSPQSNYAFSPYQYLPVEYRNAAGGYAGQYFNYMQARPGLEAVMKPTTVHYLPPSTSYEASPAIYSPIPVQCGSRGTSPLVPTCHVFNYGALPNPTPARVIVKEQIGMQEVQAAHAVQTSEPAVQDSSKQRRPNLPKLNLDLIKNN